MTDPRKFSTIPAPPSFEEEFMSNEEPTGQHHVPPTVPPGANGEVPESITGELRTTITSMQKIKTEVLDHLKGVGEALNKLTEGLESLTTLVQKVDVLEAKVEKLEGTVEKLEQDVATIKKHYRKTVVVG